MGTSKMASVTVGREVGPYRQIKICQLNLHHSRAASAMMSRCFGKDGMDIALIQEPWIFKGKVRGLPERVATLHYISADKNRSCILVRHGIEAVLLPHLCTADLVAIRVGVGAGSFVLASAYMPYDSPEPPPGRGVGALVRECEVKDVGLVIGCDANAHNTVWGSTDDNHRGVMLHEFVVRNNIFIMNRGVEPTFADSRRREVIDITLCNAKMMARQSKWKVMNQITMSDHRAIYFELEYGTLKQKEVKRIRIPQNTDRIKYREVLEGNLTRTVKSKPKTTGNVETQLNVLHTAMLDAYHRSCPLTIVEEQDPTPWWCGELEKLKKEVRKTFNHALRDTSQMAWNEYKIKKREMKKSLRQRKRKSWRDFCSEMGTISEVSRLQKMVTRDPVSRIGLVRDGTGKMTETLEETNKILMEEHFPGSQISSQGWVIQNRMATRLNRKEAEGIVTIGAVLRSIDSFKPFKKPGVDKIFPALIQWGSEVLTPRLREIYVTCLATGFIPTAWRETKVVFLPKPGRGDYTEAKSFRPISLTSFLLKTMERILVDYMEATTLRVFPLNKNQHAYQAGKSTETALHQLVRVAEDELNTGGIAMTTIMDIEGAFDKIQFGKLKRALKRRGVSHVMVRWIDNMLKNRAINIHSGGLRLRGKVNMGCPQGGVLSPLLWNITVDSLLNRLEEQNVHSIGYADDIAIMVRGKFISTVADIMRTALGMTERWCVEHDLSINARKTNTILFSKRIKDMEFGTLSIFGTDLAVSRCVKYLGVYLDSRLTWNMHISEKIRKAKVAIHQCRRVCGLRWGFSPRSMYWVYTMMIRPIITYASVVWWHKAAQKVVGGHLERVQRLACMAITGAFRTTPTTAMEMLLGLLPLELFVKKIAVNSALRMVREGTWHQTGSIYGHRRVLGLVKSIEELDMPMDEIKKVGVRERYHKTFIENGTLPEMGSDRILIFTDGSLMEDGAGAGIYSEELNLSCQLSLGKFTSVYQAEMLALIHALDHLEVSMVGGRKILVALDNQAVIRSMKRTKMSTSLAFECVHRLNRIASRNEVTLVWVRGHSGIDGNERADNLAKRGSTSVFTGPEPYAAIGGCMVRDQIEKWIMEEHRKRWENMKSCRQSKLAIRYSTVKSTREILSMERGTLRKLVAIATGHGGFGYHLKRMKILSDDTCRLCMEDEETAAHVVCQCPALTSKRLKVIGMHLCKESDMYRLTFKQMLDMTRDTDVEGWLDFYQNNQPT